MFGVEKYRNSLLKVCEKRDIKVDLFRNLIEIDPARKEATFEHVNDENSPKKTEKLKVPILQSFKSTILQSNRISTFSIFFLL